MKNHRFRRRICRLVGVLLVPCLPGCGNAPDREPASLAQQSPGAEPTVPAIPLLLEEHSSNLRRVVLTAGEPAGKPGVPPNMPEPRTPLSPLTEPNRSPRPLAISGSAIFQEGLLPNSSYWHHGTFVCAAAPATNYGTYQNYYSGIYTGLYLSYLRFDLSGTVPEGSQIVRAVLSMYAESLWGSPHQVSSHKVLSAWNESTLTYNTMPADWNNQIYESTILADAAYRWWDWDITLMTSDWVANPQANFGLSIFPTGGVAEGDLFFWCSDDHPSVSLRPKLTVDYLLPEHRSIFVSQTAPPQPMLVGERATVAVSFQNNGADSWADADGYRLGSQSPADNLNWGLNRVPLPKSVAMGERVDFTFEITAPSTPGTRTFQWQMIHEGVQWFGDLSPSLPITVNLKPNGATCADHSECISGICVDQVCCDSGCAGTCRHCAMSGFVGNCRYIPAGTDPQDECPGVPPCGSSCNGSGSCVYTPAATACAPCAACNGLGSCSQFQPLGSDPGGICGTCMVCPGDGPNCVAVAAGQDPYNECSEQPPESCGLTGSCDGSGSCAFHPRDTVCSPERCESDIHHPADLCDGAGTCLDRGSDSCLPYVCLDAVHCRADCNTDADCIGTSRCENNGCVAYLLRGEPCNRDPECISTHCVDGVCCEVACNGPCQACNRPTDPGSCLSVPDGEDPRDDCFGTGLCGGVCDGLQGCRFAPVDVKCAPCTMCDGAGTCSRLAPLGSDPFDDCAPCFICSGVSNFCQVASEDEDPLGDCPDLPEPSCATRGLCDGAGSCKIWPAGTICQPSSCTDGLLKPADLCDGQGVCVDAGEVDCNGYVCLADNACRTACENDGHCGPSSHCEQSSCVGDFDQGAPCAHDGECATGHCTDGICCNSACAGICERCDRFESIGYCTFILAGQDPDRECSGQGACAGSCNGAGACDFPGQVTACGPCARCDGQGGCTVMVAAGTDPNNACGPCRVCAGNRDACLPVSAGADPLSECGSQPPESCGKRGACDGRGACRLWPPGTVCGAQYCSGGNLTRIPTCDGAGNCVNRGAISCAPYVCDGDNCAGPEGLHHVTVEDQPGGVGHPVGSLSLTTDDRLELYAVGRNQAGGYLTEVLVTWRVEGGIGNIPPGPSSSAIFDPTTVGQGRAVADFYHAEILDGSTGDLAVEPGVAAGWVELVADPALVPADGFSRSLVTGGPVTDADGNLVGDGSMITIVTSAGSLLGEDDDRVVPGFQRLTRAGIFSFVVVSEPQPARARLKVLAVPPGTAQGEGVIFFGDGRPVADAGDDQTVYAGQPVTLDGRGSSDPYGRALGYRWQQSDGTPVTLLGANTATPSFVAPPGTGRQILSFGLIAQAMGEESEPDTTRVTVIGDEPGLPAANIDLDPSAGPAPLEVSLDGSRSSAAEGASLVDYLWNFSDGSAALSGVSASKVFSKPGGVGVKLTVTDSDGRFDSARAQVSVFDSQNSPPLLTATAMPERGEAPLEVAFHAEARDPDGSIDRIEWDFGAGFALTGTEHTRLYPRAGFHTVRVRAVDNTGLESLEELEIAVSNQGRFPPHILSSPPTTARIGANYTYQPVAVGSAPFAWSLGKTIDSELRRAPRRMRADEYTGLVSWIPADNQAGRAEVTLVVQNDAGVDFQDFTIEVASSGSAKGCSCTGINGPTDAAVSFLVLFPILALSKLRRSRSRRQ